MNNNYNSSPNQFNIDLDVPSLEEVIRKLNNDNNAICTIIKNSNDAVKTLADEQWTANEKNVISDSFIPYLDNLQNKTEQELKEYIDFLQNVIRLHTSHEEMLQTTMEKADLGQNV